MPFVRTTAVGPAAPTELTEAILVRLISQFGAMQEQMADQFRQTMVTMFQMFSALHKEQIAFIHEEMDRLEDLTRELHRLQLQVAKDSPARLATAAEHPAGAGIGLARPAGEPAREPWPAPRAPSRPPELGPAAPAEGSTPPDAPAGEDIHAWLCRRMAAVKEERQSRWQKLLGLLTGKHPEAD
jgi:hypothetical protein